MKKSILAATLAATCLALSTDGAHAAEAYDNCNGYIDSVPATLTEQGVWCLRQDIATAINSGAAITIATNNVTIDCNGFKLGGLAAGTTSEATGIAASDRLNASIRNCAVRGFREGIALTGNASGGHLVERNRLDGNLVVGIRVEGSGNQVFDNRVLDTGGYETPGYAAGIVAEADLRDNVVDGVFTVANNAYVRGISSSGHAVDIQGNRVRGLSPHGTGVAQGIVSSGAATTVMHNRLSTTTGGANDRGLYFFASNPEAFCGGNMISGFTVPIFGNCTVAGTNHGN